MQGSMEFPPHLKWMLNRAIEDPEGFWGEVAEELHWFRPWSKVFDWSEERFRWFVGAETNICYNCLDHHVKRGAGNRAAIIWESGEGQGTRVLTYRQLLHEVERFAAALRGLGVKKGERVTIYMPMIPEAIIAMLATVRIGAVHSVVFGGFGHGALADRINDASSRIVIAADLGYRRGKAVPLKQTLDQALESVSCVERVIVLRRGEQTSMKEGRDIPWEEALTMGEGQPTHAVPMEANELAFILYTSGTMSKPKGTVQPHGSYQVWITAMGRWV